MGVLPTAVAIQMQFSGPAGPWTDITADVRGKTIRARCSLPGSSPTDRVGDPTEIRFSLDNSTGNVAGKRSYYTRGHRNCRPGFDYGIGVRLVVTYASVTYYKARGVLDVITPEAGTYDGFLTHCVAVGWLDEARRFALSGIPVQFDKRIDELASLLLAAMPVQPPATSIETGKSTFAYAFDSSLDGQTRANTELQRLAESEGGLIYEKGDTVQGGTLVIVNRHHRASIVADAVVLDETMYELEALTDRDDLPNIVRVGTRPRRVETALSVVFDLASEPTIGPQDSILITCSYRDPNANGQRIGAYDVVTPVATTDWTLLSATDGVSNLTAFGAVTIVGTDPGGNSSDLRIDNHHPTHVAKLTKLQLRGKPITSFAAEGIISKAVDDDARSELGEIPLAMDMPYQTDPNVGQGMADWMLALHGRANASAAARGVAFKANQSSTLLTAALALEISSRVALRETITAISDAIDWKDQYLDGDFASETSFRFNTNTQRTAQGFKCNPGVLTRVRFRLQRIGFPTGNIWAQIESDSGGSPSGTALATSVTIRSIDIQSGAFFWTEFQFPTPYTVLSAATQLHVVLYSDTPVSTSNYFKLAIGNSVDLYLNGNQKSYNGSAWSAASEDLNFQIYVKLSTATRAYYVNGWELEISSTWQIRCRWLLSPADHNRLWVLGTAGASELDATTRLGYA